MNVLLVLLAAAAGGGDDEERRRRQLEAARARLRAAMEAREPPRPAETAEVADEPPAAGGAEGERAPPAQVGQKVDKYFGTRLPPVCERLGCYLTDDGKRYYCVNPGCQKHKKRATKHSRVRRVTKKEEVFFRCPKCLGRNVEVFRLTNEYACNDCKHRWPRAPDDAGAAQD